MSYIFVDDISNGLEKIKISFVNDINYQKLPTDVMYLAENILSSDSLTEDYESMPLPCKCKVCCDSFCPCALGTEIPYKNGMLLENFIENVSKPIIECSFLCSCEISCSNRVVQKGISVSLQVFLTENKGFGVRTLEAIPKFTFVCEYVGEIIDKAEAMKRLKNRSKEDSNYVFILKEHSNDDSVSSTIIDPTCMGNVGRYFNCSCSPNLVPVPVRVDSMLPRICFFANREIIPYEELTYSYGINTVLKDEVNNSKNLKQCHCQSFNCVGVLPFDPESLA